MTVHVQTITLQGVETIPVDVQVQVRPGLSSFQIVGLPDNAVREAKERVQAAFHAAGVALPAKRITVNLAPADIAKEGNHFDLPIAVALLAALGGLPADAAEGALFMGELALDGVISPVTGVLPAAVHAAGRGLQHVFVPPQNGAEAAWAGDINVYAPTTLAALAAHLKGDRLLDVCKPSLTDVNPLINIDFSDIKGQENARRAAEIAAAGGHNILLSGPPGSGKSMLAKRLPGLLPTLLPAEALEVSMLHSVAGILPTGGLVRQRPFRDPHHSASAVALTGGGHRARPGEISLAHNGVLFLDELPEFPRQVLETLRQPLESGHITVSRANLNVRYPANFMLVAAMNPCPCGYLGHPVTACRDTPAQIQKYTGRLSGPLLDRFDLFVDVPALTVTELAQAPQGEATAVVAARVQAARQRQAARYAAHGILTNSQADGQILLAAAEPDAEGLALLTRASEKFALSARGYHRVLRVARTIADLAGSAAVERPHIAEALSFRSSPLLG